VRRATCRREESKVRIGVGLDAWLGLNFDELRLAGSEAARIGFASLWTPAGTVPDAFHVCAAWSQDTRLSTGISVVPAAKLWRPVSLAMQAATLGQLSGGRFTLGIGTGGSGPAFWESVDLPNRPIAVMRDYLTILRRLLAGQTVSYDGPTLRVENAATGVWNPERVPVLLGALGKQMLRLAGEAADGALLNWATPARIADARRIVEQGAARAGRDPRDVPLKMYIRVCVDEDPGAARRALGTHVLLYAMATPGAPHAAGYRSLFTEMGFDEVLTDLEQRRARGESIEALIDAAPDELLTSVGYFGSAERAATAFARLSEGLDEAVVRIITSRPDLELVVATMEALSPNRIEAALRQSLG
jgi:alkanesulfonate monooxygenase SsuD/methylene tetrahydromethanopterin reductase-like flavin-dependent oxidoreductase (luciferase family)